MWFSSIHGFSPNLFFIPVLYSFDTTKKIIFYTNTRAIIMFPHTRSHNYFTTIIFPHTIFYTTFFFITVVFIQLGDLCDPQLIENTCNGLQSYLKDTTLSLVRNHGKHLKSMVFVDRKIRSRATPLLTDSFWKNIWVS